jgi:hypothetical protein
MTVVAFFPRFFVEKQKTSGLGAIEFVQKDQVDVSERKGH